MRALVIDDEQLVLEGLEALLHVSLPDLTLDKTADVAVALDLAATVPYELVLLDWNLVSADGSSVEGRRIVEALHRIGSPAPIIVVSGDDRLEWPRLVFELGLAGYVPKTARGTVLIEAIEIARRGGIFLPARAGAIPTTSPRQPRPEIPGDLDRQERFPELTERQADVFRVMRRGLSDKQIARELGISESTVKTHVRAILAAAGVARRGQAVFQLAARSAHRA